MKNKIFETTDVFNTKVSLSTDTYNDHILLGHPEVDNVNYIKDTIEKPNVVYQSNKKDKRKIFFKLGADPRYKQLYMKTVVEYNNNEGSVTTSFLSKNIEGVKEGGLLYADRNN